MDHQRRTNKEHNLSRRTHHFQQEEGRIELWKNDLEFKEGILEMRKKDLETKNRQLSTTSDKNQMDYERNQTLKDQLLSRKQSLKTRQSELKERRKFFMEWEFDMNVYICNCRDQLKVLEWELAQNEQCLADKTASLKRKQEEFLKLLENVAKTLKDINKAGKSCRADLQQKDERSGDDERAMMMRRTRHSLAEKKRELETAMGRLENSKAKLEMLLKLINDANDYDEGEYHWVIAKDFIMDFIENSTPDVKEKFQVEPIPETVHGFNVYLRLCHHHRRLEAAYYDGQDFVRITAQEVAAVSLTDALLVVMETINKKCGGGGSK